MNFRHKTIVEHLELNSQIIYSYLNTEGERLFNAYGRLGSLLLLTSSERELQVKVLNWQTELHEFLNEQFRSLKEHKLVFTANIEGYKPPTVFTPDGFVFEAPISHPCFWTLIADLKKLDLLTAEIENLWLAGVIADEIRLNVSNRIINVLRSLNSRIEHATSPGRAYKGGRFTAVQFIKMLRGGFHLYVDDNEISKEIERYNKVTGYPNADIDDDTDEKTQVKSA